MNEREEDRQETASQKPAAGTGPENRQDPLALLKRPAVAITIGAILVLLGIGTAIGTQILTGGTEPETAAEEHIGRNYEQLARQVLNRAIDDTDLREQALQEALDYLEPAQAAGKPPYECRADSETWPADCADCGIFVKTPRSTGEEFTAAVIVQLAEESSGPFRSKATALRSALDRASIAAKGRLLTQPSTEAQGNETEDEEGPEPPSNEETAVEPTPEMQRIEEPRPRIPTPAPKAQAQANICQRNPEVQDAIIENLGISRCQDITGENLFRIRELEVRTDSLGAGDLEGLTNLTDLTVQTVTQPPDGLLEAAPQLESIRYEFIGERWTLTPNFHWPASLAQLTITTDDGAGVILADNALARAESLQKLEVHGIEVLQANALEGLEHLETISLSAKQEKPIPLIVPLSATALENMASLTSHRLEGFSRTGPLRFHSDDTACGLTTLVKLDSASPGGLIADRSVDQVGEALVCVLTYADGTTNLINLGPPDG